MSTVEYNFEINGVSVSRRLTSVSANEKMLNRIHEVREQQGTSLRSVARKLNLPMQEVRAQEEANADLRISELLKWQEILEVPLADLLVDNDGPLSEPIGQRASMLRVMKTAKAILESTENDSTKRLANMLVEQLVQMMPELADVSAWHTVGQRRTQEEVGRIVERSIPDSLFNDGNTH
ncbi:MAG: helix-turn-helix transcriptional regulator [Planctomycetota bacterium]